MKKIISTLALLLLLSICMTSCGLTVPRPAVKEGQFNFSVTYTMNGETKTVSGVYACEYDGTSWALDSGSHRDWSGYIVGGMKMELEIGTTEDGGTVILDLGLYPDYFMGEDVVGVMDVPAPKLVISYPEGEDGVSVVMDEAEIEEIFGYKIVSYEYAAPIANTFALFQ